MCINRQNTRETGGKELSVSLYFLDGIKYNETITEAGRNASIFYYEETARWAFMDRGIRFPYTIGVSAGACNGLSYMSGQRGRAKYSNIDLLEKYNYIGLKYLLKKRNIMDFDLLFREFPEHILPYDCPYVLFSP